MTDGSQFDHLFTHNEHFTIGSIEAVAIHTPGHTPADTVYHIADSLFVGDTLFAPDVGTARCDFPGGSADTMYDSVRRILNSFPQSTPIYLCHDYPEGKGRDMRYATTIGEEREKNIHIRDGVTKDEFIRLRTERDSTLDLPSYIFPSVQINGNAGSLTPGEFIKLSYNKKVL